MSLQIGIVGLPNSGKSTLFNALTRSHAASAENYPFCTIDPNVGVVEVPDERLNQLAKIVSPQKIIPAMVEFVDIAGLVKGAHRGEGLGNKFLSHIRNCDAIAQVVRFFEDPNVIHVHGKVDPKEDIAVIQAELILADLESVEKKLPDLERKTKSGDKAAVLTLETFRKLKAGLESGKLAIDILNSPSLSLERVQGGELLTNKPFLTIANVDENQLKNFVGTCYGTSFLPICAKIESELVDFSPDEAVAFLLDLGLKESGLNAVIRAAYRALGLHHYFTAGPKEVRAWTIPIGAKAPQAAGVIHSDFERGFISAEVIAYKDYLACNGEVSARRSGLMRQEGKEYVVRDGDVIVFRFNV
ncbi:redox-regulated ATPase YchF [Candidatus Peregrinibacteria bacterium]|nr:redox-regulated ATPase YchF [Candidatus Peregrinibacteria bacterium]